MVKGFHAVLYFVPTPRLKADEVYGCPVKDLMSRADLR